MMILNCRVVVIKWRLRSLSRRQGLDIIPEPSESVIVLGQTPEPKVGPVTF